MRISLIRNMWPRSSRGHQLPELVQSTQESQVSAVSLSATFVKWFCRDSVSLVTRRLCTFRLFDEIFYLIGWFPRRTLGSCKIPKDAKWVPYRNARCGMEWGPHPIHRRASRINRPYLVNEVGPPVPPSLLRTCTNHRLPSRVGYRLLRCKGHILRGGSWTSVTDTPDYVRKAALLPSPLASHSTPPWTQSPWPPDPWLSAPLAATSPAVESPRLPATNHHSTSARPRPVAVFLMHRNQSPRSISFVAPPPRRNRLGELVKTVASGKTARSRRAHLPQRQGRK